MDQIVNLINFCLRFFFIYQSFNIFSMCIENQNKHNQKKNIFFPSKKNSKYAGMLKLANSDDKEEYLEIKYDKNQVIININPNTMLMQNNIPTQVATPFPPINFSQKGKTWPTKTHKEEI